MKRRLSMLLLAAFCSLPATAAAAAASPEAVVQRDLETLSGGDLEGFLALYHPEAQIFGLPTDPHSLVGARWEHMYGQQSCASTSRRRSPGRSSRASKRSQRSRWASWWPRR